MEIRFISTLTPDDEENFAPSILRAATAILDQTGLAYTLRIETTNEKVFQHHHPAIANEPLGPIVVRPFVRRSESPAHD
jgi:hypothetical protein